MADLFVRLLRGELLAPGTTAVVLEILSAQKLRDKLPAWTPSEMRIAHKTGELPDVQNDSGILFFPSGPVIAAVFTNDLAAQAEGRLAIQEIGRAIAASADAETMASPRDSGQGGHPVPPRSPPGRRSAGRDSANGL